MLKLDRKKFFDGIRRDPFPGRLTATQVQNISLILDEMERQKVENLEWMAYILATAKWETAHTMAPVREYGSLSYLRSKSYWPWVGRGFVQLTWEFNYQAYQKLVREKFGVDIVADPDLAMRPDIAAFVLVHGMVNGVFAPKWKGLRTFTDKNGSLNFEEARRLVNGTDKKREIAVIAKMFHSDLVSSVIRS